MNYSNPKSKVNTSPKGLFNELNRLISSTGVPVEYVRQFLEENGLSRNMYIQKFAGSCTLLKPSTRYPPAVAVEAEAFDKLDVLVAHGFKVTDPEVAETYNLLAWKCYYGKYAAVKTLVEKYNVNVDGKPGEKIPLHSVVTHYYKDIVDYLVEHGACVDVVNAKGQNVLHVAGDRTLNRFHSKELPSRVFELLIARGVDANQRDAAGMTPLLYAANAQVGVVYACIKAGADVNVVDSKNKNALEVALEEYRTLPYGHINRIGFVTNPEDASAFQHIIVSLIHAGSDVTRLDLLHTFSSRADKHTPFALFIAKLYHWVNDLKSNPRTLTYLCILKLRKELSGKLLSATDQLHLPRKLRSMLKLEHVIPNEFETVNLENVMSRCSLD